MSNRLRRLQGPRKSLPDPYDQRQSVSAGNPRIRLDQPQDALPDISPRRKDKQREPRAGTTKKKSGTLDRLTARRSTRNQLAVPDVDDHGQPPQNTPRRSPRKHGTGNGTPGTSSSRKGLRPRESLSQKQGVEDEYDIEEEPNEGEDHTVPDEHDDFAESADENVQIDNQAPQTPEKRRPGRPRKVPQPEPQRTPLTEKRRVGRPSGSSKSQSSKSKPAESDSRVARKSTANNERTDRGSQAAAQRETGIETLRKSQVRFSGATEKNDLEDSPDEAELETRQEQPRKRPRGHGPQGVPGRPGKKARTTSLHQRDTGETSQASSNHDTNEDEEVEDDDEQTEDADSHQLFGQGRKFKEIYTNLKNVGVSHRNGTSHRANVDRNDDDVKAILRLCKKARTSLTRLQDDRENSETLPDPPREFSQITHRIQGLCGENDEFPTDFKDQDKATEIYLYVIPALVKLLKETIEAYETIDGRGARGASITIDHLQTVIRLVALILQLGASAMEYARPDSELSVVKPVKHDILKPLKEVRDGLIRYILTKEQDEINTRHRAREDAEIARQLREEEEEQARRKRENHIKSLWRTLHDERLDVTGFVDKAKAKHLRMPYATVELDQNGEPFERLEVFRHRIGPHPVHVELARQREWTVEQVQALLEGLRRYAGRRVFQDIFRVYCRGTGILSDYNVTEIVTIAADMKEHLEEEQMEVYGAIDQWVQQIPVWTNIQTMLGQENRGTAEP
ncbi:hypothetical protein M409DRAFT_60953 [Zasmidium cellare ATCC 36951]|uniref:Uncharacterized protein n=1 Tax=Zasmidium cellare ATCC 36951 TaxID=1080233 RepID=A0A6A6C0L9_ZASCE|nr:uncharacterized protein M409DRAFT_60953 [Zasmidium cellare ATCC 36951]KAF2159246.1 hypothetical protein M409DRAFT_60953 [Zasmidium cellare ATCC 36951]